MSAFDDENPFGEPTVDNPFSDPAVQQMTRKPPNIQQGLEDYNPFAVDQGDQHKPTTVKGAANPPLQYASSSGPAVMTPTLQDVPRQPPPYTKSAQQKELTTSDLQRRQEELDRKAAELERKAVELERRKEEIETNVRRNNFPPLPENFCWQPCFYLDINVEIKPQFQKVVRHLLHIWYFHTALLIVNILGAAVLLFYIGEFQRFILSIFYAGLLTPISFLCWFRPGYKAFKNDSSFNFMVFFFIFFFQFLISLDQAIGFSNSGFCGLLIASKLFNGTAAGAIVGLFIMVISLGFCVSAVLDIVLLTQIHKIYRHSEASFAKAQQEFTSEILGNEHVRGAASSVAQAAVQRQFSSQQPSNRY